MQPIQTSRIKHGNFSEQVVRAASHCRITRYLRKAIAPQRPNRKAAEWVTATLKPDFVKVKLTLRQVKKTGFLI